MRACSESAGALSYIGVVRRDEASLFSIQLTWASKESLGESDLCPLVYVGDRDWV